MVLLTDFLNGSEWKIEEEDHVKFQMFKNTGQLGIALLEDCHILEFPVALPPELDYNLPVVYKGINLDDKDKDANQIHEASATTIFSGIMAQFGIGPYEGKFYLEGNKIWLRPEHHGEEKYYCSNKVAPLGAVANIGKKRKRKKKRKKKHTTGKRKKTHKSRRKKRSRRK
jgi:hypothetical protein